MKAEDRAWLSGILLVFSGLILTEGENINEGWIFTISGALLCVDWKAAFTPKRGKSKEEER